MRVSTARRRVAMLWSAGVLGVARLGTHCAGDPVAGIDRDDVSAPRIDDRAAVVDGSVYPRAIDDLHVRGRAGDLQSEREARRPTNENVVNVVGAGVGRRTT